MNKNGIIEQLMEEKGMSRKEAERFFKKCSYGYKSHLDRKSNEQEGFGYGKKCFD